MNTEKLNKLLRINQDFYNGYAESFSSSRYSIQPGIKKLFPELLNAESILDLGCGNGNLAKVLLREGFQGRYLGVDNSPALLKDGLVAIPESERERFNFQQVDLAKDFNFLVKDGPFDAIVSFAVIHHFPAEPTLERFFNFAAQSLHSDGIFAFSCWQVKNSSRHQNRILPWSSLEIDQNELSADDLLLDWRADPKQAALYRYVHHYTQEVLDEVGNKSRLTKSDQYFSDGKEGDLALYNVWKK